MSKSNFNEKGNLFTQTDHAIVRSAVERLPGLLPEVVILKFWQDRSITEIADDLGVSAASVDSALTKALGILKKTCMRQPGFSRLLYALLGGPTPLYAA